VKLVAAYSSPTKTVNRVGPDWVSERRILLPDIGWQPHEGHGLEFWADYGHVFGLSRSRQQNLLLDLWAEIHRSTLYTTRQLWSLIQWLSRTSSCPCFWIYALNSFYDSNVFWSKTQVDRSFKTYRTGHTWREWNGPHSRLPGNPVVNDKEAVNKSAEWSADQRHPVSHSGICFQASTLCKSAACLNR
jgi:hypothetical protein